jgi:hypothetical protein
MFFNSKIESIPLAVLDLCWLNTDGSANMNPASIAESFGSLSRPQQARLEALAIRASEDRFAHVELWGSDLRASEVKIEALSIGTFQMTRQVQYGVRREWRLAPEFAAAALSALSQALARPAFGHDYLQH